MNKIRTKNNKNTNIFIIVVFFLIIINAILLLKIYGNKTTSSAKELVNQKIDKVLYQFFNELITNDIINKENVNDILLITKNNKDEIITVNYDLEKTYKILTDVTNKLSVAVNDLEYGKIDVKLYDKYLENGKNGLIINIPFFLNSNNIFINNIGPRIPVLINFNENLLTNIKTNVKNYGFNNALLEIYITVEMQKLIITPMVKEQEKFNYNILIAALVVNGSVPNFYGGNYQANSGIFSGSFT